MLQELSWAETASMSTLAQVLLVVPVVVFLVKVYLVVREAEGPDDSLACLWRAACAGGSLSGTVENQSLAFMFVGALVLL